MAPGSKGADRDRSSHIAVVGMAGRFPGADSVDAFWHNLLGGVESVTQFTEAELRGAGVSPQTLADPRYVRARAAMTDADCFDTAAFGFSPREAQITDPQHRLALELAWHALEDAAIDPARFRGAIGIYGSVTWSSYLLQLLGRPDVIAGLDAHQIMFGNAVDYAMTRAAYKLDLRGPAVVVQAACASSLVAAHLACEALVGGECDVALAGGVTAMFPRAQGYYLKPGTASADGHCRPFSRGDGTVFGEGAAFVVLKRLDDAVRDGDAIHAVVIGSAINNDGARKVGYTAPSVDGQQDVIDAALVVADVDGGDITYVEAHGTGTKLGDPIEVEALVRAYRKSTADVGDDVNTDDNSVDIAVDIATDRGYCGIGSVKSNVGHMDAAAGIGGFIKVVKSLAARRLAPTANYVGPNPAIDFAATPFYVVTEARAWDTDRLPRRGAVTSLGVGGTNAHVILEEAPALPPTSPGKRPAELLVWSAATAGAADNFAPALASGLAGAAETGAPSLADAAYTLQLGRRELPHRRFAVVRDREELARLPADQLAARVGRATAATTRAPVAFVFPSHGSQAVEMGRELYDAFPVYREWFDRGAAHVRAIADLDLKRLIFPPMAEREAAAAQVARVSVGQPAVFVAEYALAMVWKSLGVTPALAIGHSLGEYVAATVAGVFSFEDGLAIACARGRLMDTLPPGAMLIAPLGEAAMREQLEPGLYLSVVNAPEQTVVSGHAHDIAALEAKLTAAGVQTRRFNSTAPGHSVLIDPIIDEFCAVLARVPRRAPAFPVVSARTGRVATAAELASVDYWRAHFRETVRFASAVQALLADPAQPLVLECGPGTACSALVRKQLAPQDTGGPGASPRVVVASGRGAKDPRGEAEVLLDAIGQLWAAGAQIDWTGLYPGERRRRVPLPLYAFERKRYGLNTGFDVASVTSRAGVVGGGVAAAPTDAAAELPAIDDEPADPAAPAGTPPRDELERTIAGVWKRLLGREPRDVHASFFAVGGDSFQAMQLIAEVSRALAASIPPELLVGAGSIAGIADRVRGILGTDGAGGADGAGDDSGPPPSALVIPLSDNAHPRTAARGEPPLFLVHPVGGTVFIYRDLAAALAPRPIYGVQSPGLSSGPLPGDVPTVAAQYLADLAALWPSGPVLLAGASAGGAIAYELARQLRAQGRPAALVALLDTPSAADVATIFTDDLDRMYYAVGDRLGLTLDELRALPAPEQLARVLKAAAPPRAGADAAAGNDAPAIDPAQAMRLLAVFKANETAFGAYQPPPIDDRITFVRARTRRPRWDPPRPEAAWIELARGGVDLDIVDGDHISMLRPPNVEALAAVLRRAIDRALR